MRQMMRAEGKRGRKKYIPHHLYTQERNLLEATHRILYLVDQADSGFIPMVLTRQSLYNTLFFLSIIVFLRCVAFFPFLSFFFCVVCVICYKEAALLFLFEPVLNFLSLLIDTSFLKRRVFWALERFLEGREERGEGKMEVGGPLFFVIFFFFSFFLGIFLRKIEILKSWRKKHGNRLVDVLYGDGDVCAKIGRKLCEEL
ncbi:hypothetical protein TRIATDRAFT_297565 [Trichoderma atroviride IMI 206040]|uniref:Uncharacterized protein n=1 Tax=Hypocrea atroviridis (strain ATCC 20476 / IMI 206040) TaxID=452589 RepID=G9NIM3_HYPAI|nr:uncharacterized protein TRIATDRAFT_297565 [Trichoderma atroviride IMI 206040]EHK49633.1 hypothetical protein TRIATDRAFT_297565 [Trichoderma atroviride IMI 206040]